MIFALLLIFGINLPGLTPVQGPRAPANASPWIDQHNPATPLSPSLSGLDYPRDRAEPTLASHRIQGVAHDARHWYVSNTRSVYKIPLHADLQNVPAGVRAFQIPRSLATRGYNHIGDVDHFEGLLYVPIEGGEPVVSIVDPVTMTEKSRAVLSPRGDTRQIPWVAVNPLDRMITTSTFNISTSPLRHLRAYSLEGSARAWLHHTTVLADRHGALDGIKLKSLQGGAFAHDGTLFLVSDADDGGRKACRDSRADALRLGCHGLYAFGPEEPLPARMQDHANGYGIPTTMRKLLHFTPISRKSRKINLLVKTVNLSQELEGVDVFELPPGISPGISGSVHLMMANALGSALWFKHFDAPTR